MKDEATGPPPSEEPGLPRAEWDRMVDSNAEWVWAAVGQNRELFLLVWLRLADRWQDQDGDSAEAMLRDVLVGVRSGSSAAQSPVREALSASRGW